MKIIDQIKELFKDLDEQEKIDLIKQLILEHDSQMSNITFDVHKCAHCHSEKITKYGKSKGVQRFICKSCNRTFLPTTGTSLHYVKKKSELAEYGEIIKKEGLHTIAYMSERIGISIPTAFEWRHKLLLSTPKKKDKFEGETQMDDLWVLYSQKGRKGLEYSRKRGGSKRRGDNDFQVKIIAASDKKQVEMKVAKIGRISNTDIIQAVGDKFKKYQKLVTDGHKSYMAFAKEAKLEHVSFLSKNHKAETGENVQYINNLAEQFKTWINRILRGVSTKYLQNYSSYFAYTRKSIFDIKNESQISNVKVWDIFTNIEKMYEGFIKNKSVRTYRCPTKRKRKSQNWNSDVIYEYSYI
jgi:transposase-like protein